MSEVKTAVGVSPKYINDQPKILVAFFLDSGDIQQINDDHGRPIALGVFEPEAAYVTLAKKIDEARESLKRMAGVEGYVTPYISIATLCENILHEGDGVVSLIRVVDVFHYTADGELPADHRMALLLKGLLQFRGGPDKFPIAIQVFSPNEELLVSTVAPIHLNGGTHSFSVKIELAVAIRGEGLYRLEVWRGNEQMRTLPFQVRRAPHQPTPSMQS